MLLLAFTFEALRALLPLGFEPSPQDAAARRQILLLKRSAKSPPGDAPDRRSKSAW
jgi:hypothetical protein